MTAVRDVVIVGGGPGGFTAAVYAGRANLAPLVFTGAPTEDDPLRLPGGQLATTTDVENFPGFPDPIPGPELMDRMERQARRYGAELRGTNVDSIDLHRWPFRLESQGEVIEARSVILATGARAKWLGVPGEASYRNRGVSACAACDGALFRGQGVAVIGGGDTALGEALYLARLARDVHVLHRSQDLRASRILQERARATSNIRFWPGTRVDEVLGDGVRMTGLRLRAGDATIELVVDGLFVAIGHQAATSLVAGQLALDEQGYVRTEPGRTATSIPGVFAAGDVHDPHYRQAITAAGSGAAAALDAERWLAESI